LGQTDHGDYVAEASILFIYNAESIQTTTFKTKQLRLYGCLEQHVDIWRHLFGIAIPNSSIPRGYRREVIFLVHLTSIDQIRSEGSSFSSRVQGVDILITTMDHHIHDVSLLLAGWQARRKRTLELYIREIPRLVELFHCQKPRASYIEIG